MERINTGLRQIMALCRNFSLGAIKRDDIVALTYEAAGISGLTRIMDINLEEIDKIIK